MKTVLSREEIREHLLKTVPLKLMHNTVLNIVDDFNAGKIDLMTPVGDFAGRTVVRIFSELKIETEGDANFLIQRNYMKKDAVFGVDHRQVTLLIETPKKLGDDFYEDLLVLLNKYSKP